MTRLNNLVAFSQRQLRSIAHLSGRILYSGAHTLKVGPIYLLGLNPGGDPETHSDSVSSSLAELSTRTDNAYLDESWQYRARACPVGKSPLQKRVCWLLDQLGQNARDVCASNLIFTRSKGAGGSGYPERAELCWPVHEQIIAMIRPKLIIAFGNSGQSPYHFLYSKLQGKNEKRYPSGHGNWSCASFNSGTGVAVVGLPHLSRYAVNKHTDVAEWVCEIAL
jgi:hypothetical protein